MMNAETGTKRAIPGRIAEERKKIINNSPSDESFLDTPLPWTHLYNKYSLSFQHKSHKYP